MSFGSILCFSFFVFLRLYFEEENGVGEYSEREREKEESRLISDLWHEVTFLCTRQLGDSNVEAETEGTGTGTGTGAGRRIGEEG